MAKTYKLTSNAYEGRTLTLTCTQTPNIAGNYSTINWTLTQLEDKGIPKEDSALLLPLGMTTKIACKHNFRNLVDMSHQRMCTRAYWEYRELFNDVAQALREYSDEWAILVDRMFKPKCEELGYCREEKSCGRKPKVLTKHI